jgi:hypothetical protein
MDSAVIQNDPRTSEFRYSLRRLFVLIAAVCVLLAAARCLVLIVGAVTGPVLPHDLVGQLREGMTKAEVEAILGPPGDRFDDCWNYYRGCNPGWIEFYFNEGRLSEVNDESPFPNSYGWAEIQQAENASEPVSQNALLDPP